MRRPPVRTGAVRQLHRELQGPIRGHEICFNQSECVQVQMRCNWRTAPVTPGVTGGRPQCAPALSAKSHRSQLVYFYNGLITVQCLCRKKTNKCYLKDSDEGKHRQLGWTTGNYLCTAGGSQTCKTFLVIFVNLPSSDFRPIKIKDFSHMLETSLSHCVCLTVSLFQCLSVSLPPCLTVSV